MNTKLARLIAVQLAVACALLGAGEAAVRRFLPEYAALHQSKTSTGGHPVVLNSWGFRDAEHALEKPAGTRRIAVVGDSIAWGYSVGLEETSPRRLERLLNENSPIHHEVLNFSGVGKDPGMYLAWEDKIFAAKPDALVYYMCLNDVGDVYSRRSGVSATQMAATAGGKHQNPSLRARFSALKGRWRGAMRRSALWSLLDTQLTFALYRRGVLRMDPALPQFAELFAAFGGASWSEQGWTLFYQDVDALGALAKKRGIPFVVVQFPYRFMLEGERENPWGQRFDFRVDPFERMKSYTASRGYAWVDLRAAYNAALAERREKGLPYMSLIDGLDFVHPNAFGHEVAARAIAEKLKVPDRRLAGGGSAR